jgi:uncharacterized protein involved in exopolysaccharide biosynthesis
MSNRDAAFEEEKVSLVDILLVLARSRKLIMGAVIAFVFCGLVYSLTAPVEYSSAAKVIRETTDEGGTIGGLGGVRALQGLGINLGSASSGLTPAAFPQVLQSREVRLAVARDTFSFPGVDRPMTYVDYVNRPGGWTGTVLRYTVRLPWTLKGLLSEAISEDLPRMDSSQVGDDEVMTITEAEDEAISALSGVITTSVNDESGLMTIKATASGPRLAANLTNRFVRHLTDRVRELRTKKIQKRLNFVEQRFAQAEQELDQAENRLAQFLERNQNPTTARLQFQRDRLQRQVSFKEQLYSELQSRLTQTRLELQRRQPVVTVVEEAVPPIGRSSPKRTLIVLVSLVLGGMFGVVAAFLRAVFVDASREEDERKLQEIKDALYPDRIVAWVKSRADQDSS